MSGNCLHSWEILDSVTSAFRIAVAFNGARRGWTMYIADMKKAVSTEVRRLPQHKKGTQSAVGQRFISNFTRKTVLTKEEMNSISGISWENCCSCIGRKSMICLNFECRMARNSTVRATKAREAVVQYVPTWDSAICTLCTCCKRSLNCSSEKVVGKHRKGVKCLYGAYLPIFDFVFIPCKRKCSGRYRPR